MSTRSNIVLKRKNGKIDVIYCHYSGYPTHNGYLLLQYYNDIDKIKELIENGDLSNLNVVTLPKAKYISISSKENEKDEVINKLKDFVFKKYNFEPNEIVVLVKVIGITKWHYAIQTKVE